MKQYKILTRCETLGPLSYNGIIVEEVSGRPFPKDDRFFAYKNATDNKIYLVDIESGLALGYTKRWKDIEDMVYLPRIEAYEKYIQTPQYKKKVQDFAQLKEISL